MKSDISPGNTIATESAFFHGNVILLGQQISHLHLHGYSYRTREKKVKWLFWIKNALLFYWSEKNENSKTLSSPNCPVLPFWIAAQFIDRSTVSNVAINLKCYEKGKISFLCVKKKSVRVHQLWQMRAAFFPRIKMINSCPFPSSYLLLLCCTGCIYTIYYLKRGSSVSSESH